MNEQYLFRGKRLDNGEWVEGSVVDKNKWFGCYEIVVCRYDVGAEESYSTYEVDPATIGQCTGRSFSKRLAFEGDIFHIPDEQRDVVIKWDDYMLAFMAEDVQSHEDIWLNEYGDDDMFWIGNIHDNPELMEGAE